MQLPNSGNNETSSNHRTYNMDFNIKDMEDVQDEGGGGCGYLNSNAYTNPALTSNDRNIFNGNIHKGFDDFEVVGSLRDVEKPGNILTDWLKIKVRKTCTKKTLKKRLPIVEWLPNYSREDAVGDLLAGITVGLTVIPQSLAYANIAHIPLQYGLYTSFLGCLIYIFLGSCKDVPFGPTAIVSLMTYEAVGDLGTEHAILLCFLSGLVQFFMGIFGFGFMIDFISGPVASGFTSAVALIIVTSQVKDLLGIPVDGTVFIHTWTSIFKNLHCTNVWDASLGIVCIAFLLTLRIGTKIKTSGVDWNKCHIWRNRVIWFVATSRNAILVIISGYVGYHCYQNGENGNSVPFSLIGYVPSGLPKMEFPPFGYEQLKGNITVEVSFTQMVSNLGSNIVVVPLLALLENIAICKAFAHGNTVDSTQEFLAIGVCNIANSLVQSFPGSGSVSRSAVQHSSGSRTPLCGLYTGCLVIVALVYFTPCFYYIPKSALAAVLISAVIFMVEIRIVKPMWRTKRSDLIPGVGTFIACLVLPLEIGVLIGVGINVLFILHQAARPKITIERLKSDDGVEYLMLTPDRCLIFPSVDYVRNLVTKNSTRAKIPVVLDCSYIYGADYTAACVVEILTANFAQREQLLIFYNLRPSVCDIFEGLSPKSFNVVYNREELHEILKNEIN